MSRHASKELLGWLLDPGSFMQRLKHFKVDNARVRVLQEGWSSPTNDERILLNIPFRKLIWAREVSIFSDKTIWMFARTVIPQQTLTGAEKQLRYLKTRSLGSILFKYSDMRRSDFEIFDIEAKSFWERHIANYLPLPQDVLWARRSTFHVREKPLLLTEVFFPSVAWL